MVRTVNYRPLFLFSLFVCLSGIQMAKCTWKTLLFFFFNLRSHQKLRSYEIRTEMLSFIQYLIRWERQAYALPERYGRSYHTGSKCAPRKKREFAYCRTQVNILSKHSNYCRKLFRDFICFNLIVHLLFDMFILTDRNCSFLGVSDSIVFLECFLSDGRGHFGVRVGVSLWLWKTVKGPSWNCEEVWKSILCDSHYWHLRDRYFKMSLKKQKRVRCKTKGSASSDKDVWSNYRKSRQTSTRTSTRFCGFVGRRNTSVKRINPGV